MLRVALPPVLQVLLAVSVVAGSARAQTTDASGELSKISLPGSLRDALVAADDRVPGDRSQFLLEFIRRTYNTPVTREESPARRGVAIGARVSRSGQTIRRHRRRVGHDAAAAVAARALDRRRVQRPRHRRDAGAGHPAVARRIAPVLRSAVARRPDARVAVGPTRAGDRSGHTVPVDICRCGAGAAGC